MNVTDWLFKSGLFNISATVTLKQALPSDNGTLAFISYVDCSKTACVLRDRLTKKIIGQSRYRKGERLNWLTFIESGHGDKRLHLHLIIERPDSISFSAFKKLIGDVCSGLEWVYEQKEIKEIKDIAGSGNRAATCYSLKEGGDAFDLQSSFLRNHQIG